MGLQRVRLFRMEPSPEYFAKVSWNRKNQISGFIDNPGTIDERM